jgi:hypothetical protein
MIRPALGVRTAGFAIFVGLVLVYNANRSVLLGKDTRAARYVAVSDRTSTFTIPK